MFTALPRPLPYPLDRASNLEALTENDREVCGIPEFPEDSDERVTILFSLSLNEFVALATAIDVGSDIAFGEDGIKVWHLWAASVMCANFCEEVTDCIDNSEGVRNALAQWFSYAAANNAIVKTALQNAFNPALGGSPIPQEYADSNQYGAALGCDNDTGYGHIRNGLIERSFERVQQALERIEFVTDNQEMLAEFVNAIPGVGAFFDVIPVTDWILFFDNVRNVLKDAFEAGDSTDLRDAVACDLFCIWQINCSLSVEQIRQYYWTKTVEILPSFDGAFDSFSALGAALASFTAVSASEQAVYALVGSQYGFLTYLNDWFGIHINSTANDLALGSPSSEWMTLCDDCPTTFTWQNVGIIGSCGEGVKSSGEFEDGVPFDVVAYNDTTYPAYWTVALNLPPGDWNVTLNSIAGTIVPPSDLNESAWAYMDTVGVWQQAQWNTPATPADFGSHDTTATIFTVWCSTQDWNAYLSNCGAFTANFTVTAL